MKTLIEKTIRINDNTSPKFFETFMIDSERIENGVTFVKYKPIVEVEGKVFFATYKYSENGIINDDTIVVVIENYNENIDVRNYITSEINTKLNS
jgi:hypothetical protein